MKKTLFGLVLLISHTLHAGKIDTTVPVNSLCCDTLARHLQKCLTLFKDKGIFDDLLLFNKPN